MRKELGSQHLPAQKKDAKGTSNRDRHIVGEGEEPQLSRMY